jgi:AraC family transcriptional regulator
MKPKLTRKPGMTLVGLVGCAPEVGKLDIGGLWQRFEDKHSRSIKHQVEGKGYEIHIEEETTPPMHFCLVGVEVGKLEDLPVELFAKVVPACEYAVFTHHFRDGGFGHAFKVVYDWLSNSDYASAYQFDIQCYDSRFKSPEDPESIIEIWVPVNPRQR